MRKIIFRGKEKRGGLWLVGDLAHGKTQNRYIFNQQSTGSYVRYEVDPETVGQYIGMEDRNGSAIYEGDVVQEYVMGDLFEVVFTDYGNFGLKPFRVTCPDVLKGHEYETIDPSYAATSLTVVNNIYDFEN